MTDWMETMPAELKDAIEDSLDMIREQMERPGVYDGTAQASLDKISAYAALFKMYSAKYYMEGNSKAATAINRRTDALEYMINSLKYKIKGVVG